MPKDIKQLLSDVGLLPSETKVYLSTLELGPSTVQNISKKANISRTATYEAIEMLRKRGLMTTSTSGKRTLFTSEDPSRIVSYLKTEQQKFATTLGDIEQVIDSVRLMAGGIKPMVKVYEGEEALHAYFDQLAKALPEEFDEITNIDDVYAHISGDTLTSARNKVPWNRIKKLRVLYRGTLRNPHPHVEFCQLDSSYGEFHGDVSVYGNFVALITFVGKPVVVILESPVLAQTVRTIFNVAWRMCSTKK